MCHSSEGFNLTTSAELPVLKKAIREQFKRRIWTISRSYRPPNNPIPPSNLDGKDLDQTDQL